MKKMFYLGNKKADLSSLVKWYRASKKIFDEDDEF